MNYIISNDCKNLQGITAEHLDELTIVNIALLTLPNVEYLINDSLM